MLRDLEPYVAAGDRGETIVFVGPVGVRVSAEGWRRGDLSLVARAGRFAGVGGFMFVVAGFAHLAAWRVMRARQRRLLLLNEASRAPLLALQVERGGGVFVQKDRVTLVGEARVVDERGSESRLADGLMALSRADKVLQGPVVLLGPSSVAPPPYRDRASVTQGTIVEWASIGTLAAEARRACLLAVLAAAGAVLLSALGYWLCTRMPFDVA